MMDSQENKNSHRVNSEIVVFSRKFLLSWNIDISWNIQKNFIIFSFPKWKIKQDVQEKLLTIYDYGIAEDLNKQ